MPPQQNGAMALINRVAERYDEWSTNHPAIATVAESAAVFAVRQAFGGVANRVGIPTGNALKARKIEQAKGHPIVGALYGAVLTPLAEEAVFHAVNAPARRAEAAGQPEKARAYRLGTAAVFAWGHSGIVRPAEKDSGKVVAFSAKGNTIPLEQFAGRLNYDRLNKKRGFRYGVLGHIVTNTLDGVVTLARQRSKR